MASSDQSRHANQTRCYNNESPSDIIVRGDDNFLSSSPQMLSSDGLSLLIYMQRGLLGVIYSSTGLLPTLFNNILLRILYVYVFCAPPDFFFFYFYTLNIHNCFIYIGMHRRRAQNTQLYDFDCYLATCGEEKILEIRLLTHFSSHSYVLSLYH